MSLSLSVTALNTKMSSTLAITAKAQELKAQGLDVISFSAGEPDFDTPEHIAEAGIKAIKEGFTRYTAATGTPELKKAISDKFRNVNHIDYAPDQIVVSNGGKHSLSNVFTAIINPGDEVIIPAPFWVSYPEMVKLVKGVPVIVYGDKENNYKVTAEQVRAAVTENTKALVINSPNNPTGMVYTKNELLAIAQVAVEKDFYIVSDEIYENLLYTGEEYTSVAALSKEIYDRTITVNGLAKSYAMTGWRIGYTGASKEITQVMTRIQSHQTSNPNSIAQKAALAAIAGDQTCVKEMLKAFAERSVYMYERVCAIEGFHTVKPMGAFYVFVDINGIFGKKYKGKAINSAADFASMLLEDYYVAVVPCDDFGYTDHFRMSYATSMENIKNGMDRIAQMISELTD
ncbi:MAG: pyridoxal phosphate-dependent aminotransferase [Parasporobacterium sp.]|nr:pyridoxal phosphate-dependent aminotransferase [Parasporobacterium sp.]